MYYLIIRKLSNRTTTIAWTQSDFLFREYLKAVTNQHMANCISIESCMKESDLKWIFKKYEVSESKISESKIILLYDRSKTVYGVTTCRSQRVGLGGRNLFRNTEDTIRSRYVSALFWHITYLKRYSQIGNDLINILYQMVRDKYLDRHSIDMMRYMIESNSCPSIYKI